MATKPGHETIVVSLKGTRWVSLCTYVIQTDYICQNLKFDFNDLCCRKSLKSGVERQTQDNVQTGETNPDSHLQTPSSPTPPLPQKKKKLKRYKTQTPSVL